MYTTAGLRRCGCLVIAILCLITLGAAAADTVPATTAVNSPSVFLNLNEGSGNIALDASGHGNTAAISGKILRISNNGCVKAIILDGTSGYIAIPYTAANHPGDAVTVSLWFYVNDTYPQTLVSTLNNGGGYRLGFDDGNDLWWTLGFGDKGTVSVVVPHEGITPGQWHHATGTYNGQTMKIYLDGILRSQANATGPVVYPDNNYVIVGAEAGSAGTPDPAMPRYLAGGVDEVRIYNRALAYGDVMDDRYACTPTPGTGVLTPPNVMAPVFLTSGSLALAPDQTATRYLVFSNRAQESTWHVTVPPGSQLSVSAQDAYASVYPDEWYVELKDGNTRITRIVAFPETTNSPASGTITSGNATVIFHYFGGSDRFPAGVTVSFTSPQGQKNPANSLPAALLEYPIIVIYSASWATLIALVIVVLWAHKRRTGKK